MVFLGSEITLRWIRTDLVQSWTRLVVTDEFAPVVSKACPERSKYVKIGSVLAFTTAPRHDHGQALGHGYGGLAVRAHQDPGV